MINGIKISMAGLLVAAFLPGTLFAAVYTTAKDAFSGTSVYTSARGLGLGATDAVVPKGPECLETNPAGLATIAVMELGLEHGLLPLQGSVEQACFGLPYKEGLGLGFSAAYSSWGGLEQRDNFGQLTDGSLNPFAYSLRGGAGWHVAAMKLDLGASLAILGQNIAGQPQAGFSTSWAAFWHPAKEAGISLGINNLGGGAGPTPLPASFFSGGSWRFSPGRSQALILGMVAEGGPDGFGQIGLGGEYLVAKPLALRLGYNFPWQDQGLGGLSGLAAGLGIKVSSWTLDYSAAMHGDLGMEQKIGLAYEFTAPVAQAPQSQKQAPDLSRARAMASQGQTIEALREYLALTRVNPGNKAAWVEAGQLYLNLRHNEDAKKCFQWALRADPNDVGLRKQILALPTK